MSFMDYVAVLQRRWLVACAVAAAGLGLVYALRNSVPSTFVGVSHVVLVADNGARDPSVSIVDLPSIATSTVVLERVRDALHLPFSLVKLKANVGASVLGRSSIMAVSFRDPSSEKAIAVSNALADQLSRYYDQISTQRYNVNVDRLSREIVTEGAAIRTLDRKIAELTARNPFVASDKAVDLLTTQVASVSVERARAFAQLQGDRALAATTASTPELSKTARHEILAGDPAYVALRNAIGRDRAELARQQGLYTEDYPGIKGQAAKLATETKAAEREVSAALSDPSAYSSSQAGTSVQHSRQVAVVDGDQARLEQLDAVMATAQENLDTLPALTKQYEALRAQRNALLTEYSSLSTRRANALANRAEASSLGSVVVLDRALKADTQLTGGRTRMLVVSLFLIVAAAFGAAFLIDALDRRIRRREQVEELYGHPVVARFGARA